MTWTLYEAKKVFKTFAKYNPAIAGRFFRAHWTVRFNGGQPYASRKTKESLIQVFVSGRVVYFSDKGDWSTQQVFINGVLQ